LGSRGQSPHINGHWEISGRLEFASFCRNLLILFDPGAVLYLEGTATPRAIGEYLKERSVRSRFRIGGGTLLPTPEVFHLPLTSANLDGLVEALEAEPRAGVCTHVHVYRDETVLLQWFDASAGEEVKVAASVPEEALGRFCKAMGCTYQWDARPLRQK
jgi:hypothetical protein